MANRGYKFVNPTKIPLTIEKRHAEELKRMAQEKKVSRNDLIIKAIELWLGRS